MTSILVEHIATARRTTAVKRIGYEAGLQIVTWRVDGDPQTYSDNGFWNTYRQVVTVSEMTKERQR